MAQQQTIARRGTDGLSSARTVAMAVVLAIAVIAAVVLAYAFAPGGPLAATSAGNAGGVTVPALDIRENAPQR